MADDFEERLKKLPPPPPEGAGFVPLHCHSHFSILDGLNPPEEIALRARELGHKAVALTDHGSCGGLYHFQKACVKCGVKPILGMEAYVVDNTMVRDKDERKRHLTIWASSPEGFRNLIALSSKGYIDGFYSKPRISLEDIEKRKAGLVVGSACIKGIVCDRLMSGERDKAMETAAKLKDILGDAFYCEVMSHKYVDAMKGKQSEFAKAMKGVLEVADSLGIKSVLTYDSHYCRPEDAFYHDILLCIQTKDTIKNPNRFSFHSSDFYMKSFEEVSRICQVRKDLLSNTLEVAERVSGEVLIRNSPPLLPDFQLPPGVQSEEAYLKELIREGMIERGIFDKQEYRDRILSELDVITKCGFVRYFLILWDVVNYARRSSIALGPGRGSGAASLCLYSLGVTQLDPIKQDLLFARFLNPDRVSPPDVDLDFDDSKQQEMFNYVARKYGQECVSRIGSYTAPKVKDAIKRTAKALDIGGDWERSDSKGKGKGKWKSGAGTMDVVDILAKVLPIDPKLTMEEAKNVREVTSFVERYPELFKVSEKILGTLVASGVHPAGIIISRQKVAETMPLRSANGVACTQFDMKEVEPLGMLKFDFLGLRTLRVVDNCIKMVKTRTGDDIKIDALEPSDPEVFKLLNAGKVDGIFQFESGEGRHGISGLLRDIRVDSFEDMIATCALYRPGTLKGKWDGKSVPETYCDYKHGRKPIKYLHPKMEKLLKSTYGLMCFDASQNVYSSKGPIHFDKVVSESEIMFRQDGMVKCDSPARSVFSSGVRQVFEYRLSDGRSIRCTEDHTFQIADGSYVKIDDIFKDNIPLPWVPGLLDTEDKAQRDIDKAYLFGFLIGDGALSSSTPTACCGSFKINADKISNVFKACYKNGIGHIYFSTRCWYVSMGFGSRKGKLGPRKSPLLEDLRQLGLCVHSDEKRMPFGWMSSNRFLYLSLAAGLIDSDGCICSDVHFTSGNKDLLDDFGYLAWRLGYRSYLSGHTVHISESKRFFDEIRPFLHLKNDVKAPICVGRKMLLDGHKVATLIMKAKGLSSLRSFCSRYCLNRSTIARILGGESVCEWQTVDTIVDRNDAIKLSCISVVNKTPLEERAVFDFSMAPRNGNNFIVAPGIVAHNCYQEQVMLVSQDLASFTNVEADWLRKAIGKKDDNIMKTLVNKFVDGCVKNGIDKSLAEKIFYMCKLFSGYGFNRAHAAAYALLAYQTAWLKTHYPVEYMCSLMSANSGDDKKIPKYERATEAMGIQMLPHHINKSRDDYSIEGRSIRRPLSSLKGLGDVAVKALVAAQPFESLEDFAIRVDAHAVNSRVFTTLVESKCMDFFGMTKPQLEEKYAAARKKAKLIAKQKVRDKGYDPVNLFDCPI